MAKKTIFFELEENLDPKYKDWAREAVEEFIALFPEFEDCLEISDKERKSFFTRREAEQAFSNLSNQNIESLISQFFEKQPNGLFLLKGSVQHMLKEATTNGRVDLEKWSDLKRKSLQHQYGLGEDKRALEWPIGVSITSIPPKKGYALSGTPGPCISTAHFGNNKDYFKRTVMHELGHTFQMHEHEHSQTNTWGPHCIDSGCLGSQSGPSVAGACFCEHCMGAMRSEMQMIKNVLKEKERQSANNNRQNRTETNASNEQDFLSGLSDEEKAFLKDYLDYIRSSGIRRSKEDLLWDRVYLLEKFRSQRQNTNATAQSLKQEFKTIAETFDWKKEEYKNKLPPQTRQKIETFLTRQAGQSIEVNDQPLQPTEEKEKNTFYKTQLRGILRDSARAEHLEYNEESRKQGFKAELKAADGSKTTIEANNSQQISLMAHNEKGEKVVPPFRRFMDIVSYAQLRHSSVSFGEIKTPEFKASLMIACLKAQPPVRMKGAPKMTEEFLNLLNPQTAKALHEAYYSRRIEKELPTYQGLKRSQAERYLQLKNQKEPLGQREWSELFYHEDQLVGDIALSDAQKKFKSERPREEEWHQKTGYEPQRVVHYEDKRPGDASWKLHLDVTPNPEEPTTKAITQYLEKLDMDYKICGGEENGKGITIYVGSYLDTLALSTRLQMEFGDKVKLPARYTDQYNQETEFHNVATGRFMIAANYDPETKTETPVFDEVYPTTVRGISPARLEEHNSTGFLIKTAKQMKLIPEQTPDDYKQITDAKQHYNIDMLENYVSHRLYAKHLGAFYYGDNAKRFEEQLFNDKLPEAGSPERTKWNILANKYEQFIQDNCPEKIDLMKKHIENYKPIDFTKENTSQNSQQQEKPDLTQQVIDAKRKRTR